MKIRNFELKDFGDFLLSEELVGKKSRFRSRFVKLANEQLALIDSERIDLLKQYAKKDENKQPVLEDDGNSYKMEESDRNEFLNEYYNLMNEEFVVEENEANKEMLLVIKDVVLNTERSFSGQQAMQYDRWCEIVESMYPES
ncbi:hypothetical protein QB910_000034 [Dabrowskivirus KKP3916]|uniref:Uncharacterized protein n=1 Tax=Alicyclobacillus phage KKP_3916 TaxID=3040651 RepID=A0AAT9V7M6_9CAUD|nr:hypothetical protein QB910_000034 [Alicyclobacillus phage KKP 3916]